MKQSLSIETSSRIGSVALAEDGRALAEETFEHGLQHAARIVPAWTGSFNVALSVDDETDRSIVDEVGVIAELRCRDGDNREQAVPLVSVA